MTGPMAAPGIVAVSFVAVFGSVAVLATTTAPVADHTPSYSVRIADARGTWAEEPSSPSVVRSARNLTVRKGSTITLEFASDDYIYLLSQSQLNLNLLVIPDQPCSTTVTMNTPGRYDVTARGFCADPWQHMDPLLRIECRP
jgi:heme/copper-type cytochrome/quinol oxidase subunit 2